MSPAYSGPCAVEDPEKNSAKLAANFEDSRNQRGFYFPRRAHCTKTVCSEKPPRFRGKGQDECLQSRVKMDRPKTGRSARWGAACAPCAQQRHAAFAPSLRGHNNVIDAEVWRKTAWVKLLVKEEETSQALVSPCSCPVILFAHQHLAIAWGGHTLCP